MTGSEHVEFSGLEDGGENAARRAVYKGEKMLPSTIGMRSRRYYQPREEKME